ncbi:hypothetical protein HY772_03385 [Candidatus Woesearchaeota archaeon]|nr:hypothetical protein [Candidatus Woesearchaeota archaeon]
MDRIAKMNKIGEKNPANPVNPVQNKRLEYSGDRRWRFPKCLVSSRVTPMLRRPKCRPERDVPLGRQICLKALTTRSLRGTMERIITTTRIIWGV